MALKVNKAKEKQQVHDNLMKVMNEQKSKNTTSDTVNKLKEEMTEINNKTPEPVVAFNAEEKIILQEQKKTGGRPKKYSGERSKFTIYVSEEMMDYVDMATKCTFSDNRSDYIVKLIQKDLEENKEKYKMLYKK